MGSEEMGKNMLACSSESQSLSGRDFEAVTITRKERWATESSPKDILTMVSAM